MRGVSEPAATPPRVFPAADGGVQFGAMLMQPVRDGYECRWYRLPPNLPSGVNRIPAEDLEFICGGFCDRDGNLVRPLDG
jgi:hypothetical protein